VEQGVTRRTIVVKQFFNEIDVRQDHSSAAVTLELKLIQGISTKEPLESRD
jgi:hypothetical protein